MKKSLILFFVVGVFGFAAAQVPRTISYQGFYTDASGNPVNGAPHKVTFRFFDAVTNAENTTLAREIENITINKGVISVTIGGGDPSHTSGPDNAALPLDVWTQAYKIQVSVDGTSIGDQVPLTTVPYAFVAGSVDGANVTGTLAASKISGTVAGTQIGTGINASNITTGTLNPSLFTDGSIPGTKLALDINATNIASGTLSDLRLESTLDVTGVNTSGNITTVGGIHVGGTSDPGTDNLVVDGTITGNGSGISSLNAANISSGTISDSRLESTLDVTGLNTSGNITTVGGIHVGGTSDPGADNLVVDGTITGDGSGISAINATNISSGTIADARLETNIDVSGFVTTVGGVHVGGTSNPGVDNLVVDGTITGNGSGITGISAGNISAGTLADARLESTLDVTAVNTTGNITAGGTFNGNGSGITTLNATNLSSGTLANGRLATNIDVAGNLTTVGGIHVGGTSNPGTDNLVVDGTITGNGSGITTLNASNISSGTLANGRLSTNVDVAGYVTAVTGMRVGSSTAPGANNLEVDGYTKLGGSGISVTGSTPPGAAVTWPTIRVIQITGTCAAADGTANVTLSGLAEAKIISINVIVEMTTGDYVHAGYTNTANLQFNFFYQNNVLNIRNIAGNSASLAGRPFKATIIYEQ